jgi:hypothetical protein
MQAFGKFDRAYTECLLAFRKADFSGDSLEQVTDAAYEFEAARFRMLLEAPHDPVIAAALTMANRKLQSVMYLYVDWKRKADIGDPIAADLDHWNDEVDREQKKFRAARNSLFVAMRNDLHREVEGDFVHGFLRIRLAKGRRRRYPPVPPLPDDD